MRRGLDDLEAILAVARHRSFRAAATELGLSRSALSHAVASIEERLGVRLFHRTTRSVSLTEAGTQFIDRVMPALETIRSAMDRAGEHRAAPAGTLRINLALGAARQLLAPVILEYLRRYPDMRVDLVTEGALIDIVQAGFDAGIRLAEAVPQDMIAIPFGPGQRMVVVGTPGCLARGPTVLMPQDLLHHSCIRIRMASGRLWHWEFERRGQTARVEVSGPLTLDDMDLMLIAARAGIGLVYVSQWAVIEDLASGILVQVLEDWTPSFPGLCLYYSGRRHLPPGLRAFVDLVHERRSVTDLSADR